MAPPAVGTGAVRFDATTDTYATTTNLPAAGSSFTVTCWVRVDNLGQEYHSVFGLDRPSSEGGYALALTAASGFWYLWDEAFATISGGAIPETTGDNPTGIWQRIAVVVDGATWRLGITTAAGTLSLTSANRGNLTASQRLRIASNVYSENLNGELAAFKMWNAALTLAEINAEHAQYAPVRTADLARYYPFIEAPGTADAGPNGWNLTAGTTATATAQGPGIDTGAAPAADLTVRNARAATRATRPLLAQTTTLTVRAARANSTASRPLLAQQHPPLVIDNARAATRATTPTLTQHAVLDVAAARAATTTTAVDLTAPLLVDGARATTAAPRPVLGHTSPVTADDAQAATTAGSVELDQRSVLTVTEARAATTTDRPLLVGDADLVVHEARATTNATGPLLDAPTILGVHHTRAVTTATRVLLEQTHPPLHVDNTRAETTAGTATITGPDTLVLHASRAATQASRVALAQQTTVTVLNGHATTAAHRVLLALTAATDPAAVPASVQVTPMAATVHTHPTVGRVDHTPATGTVHVH